MYPQEPKRAPPSRHRIEGWIATAQGGHLQPDPRLRPGWCGEHAPRLHGELRGECAPAPRSAHPGGAHRRAVAEGWIVALDEFQTFSRKALFPFTSELQSEVDRLAATPGIGSQVAAT